MSFKLSLHWLDQQFLEKKHVTALIFKVYNGTWKYKIEYELTIGIKVKIILSTNYAILTFLSSKYFCDTQNRVKIPSPNL